MPQIIEYPLKTVLSGQERLAIQEPAGGAGSSKQAAVDALLARQLGWTNIEHFGAVADGPIPTNAIGTPSTAGATISTGPIIAAAAAAAGGVLYIPPSATGRFVVDGKIPIYGDTKVYWGGPSAGILLADNAKLTGRESTHSIDIGIFELATDHERRVTFDGWGRIYGQSNRQLGHSSGKAWTLAARAGTDITESTSSLNFAWSDALVAGDFPTPPFPVRFCPLAAPVLPAAGTCEVCIVETLDPVTKTGTLRAGTRGMRETAAAIWAVGTRIKVEYSGIFFDMSTNSEPNATGQLEEHAIQNMWLMHTSGNGIHLMGLGDDLSGRMHHVTLSHIYGHNCDGHLARMQSSDGTCDSVVSSLSGRQAICIPGGNWHGRSNKGFNSGRVATDLGIGLDISGARITNFDFEGQDNNWAAARISGPDNDVQIVADSNGRVTIQDGTGVILDGAGGNCKNNTVTIKSFSRSGQTDAATNRQAYSVTILNDGSNGVDDNRVIMNNRRLTKADIFGDPIGNGMIGDGQSRQQSVAFAANIVPHPDLGESIIVGTLTGATVLKIPTNKSLDASVTLPGGVAGFGPCYRGQEIEVIYTQGAGGDTVDVSAYIVTNAAWLRAGAGLKSVFRAKCISADGLTWMQM